MYPQIKGRLLHLFFDFRGGETYFFVELSALKHDSVTLVTLQSILIPKAHVRRAHVFVRVYACVYVNERKHIMRAAFVCLFNTVPLHSLKYNSQRRSNRRNRGLELIANTSKELILIKTFSWAAYDWTINSCRAFFDFTLQQNFDIHDVS